MFEEKPEISETLEWMLQSRQVGCETLVYTIVHELYPEIYRLAVSLLNPSDPEIAVELAEKTILEAVGDAHNYHGDIRVQVWLFQKVVASYKRLKSASMFSDSRSKVDPVEEGIDASAGDSNFIWKAVDSLERNNRLTYLLRYYHDLSIEEVAAIIDVPKNEVVVWLKLAEQNMEEFFSEHQVPRVTGGEICQALSKRWPSPVFTAEDEKQVARKLYLKLQDNERRRYRVSVIYEITLIATAIVIVVSMGLAIMVLSPEPTPAGLIYQTQLVNQIVYVTPTPGPTLPPTPFPELAILYEAEVGETLVDIADWTFLNVEILAALNNLSPDQPLERGQKVMIGVRDLPQLMPTRVGVIPAVNTPIPSLEPLTFSSTQEEIRQRILDSRLNWHTLWSDAFIVQYGPPGYVGEPNVRRQQIWINQPYFSYLIDGGIVDVEYISVAYGGLINFINLQTGEEQIKRDPEIIHTSHNIQQMVMPSELRGDFIGDLEVLEIAEEAGREALVFDLYLDEDVIWEMGGGDSTRLHLGRYWVDTYFGVILRRQRFNNNDLTQLFDETILTKIDFNFDIPHRLFNRNQPVQTYFAQDLHGNPASRIEPVPTHLWSQQPERTRTLHLPPPADLDPARSRLTFQWTSLSVFDSDQGTLVDLFADGYFLDNIEFAGPYVIFCKRSPDGNLIAFTGWSDTTRYGYEPLRWFSLSDLPNVHQSLSQLVPYDFAFSPDSRHLAVYGCDRFEERGCGIHILDIESGEARRLTDVESGSGLTWSPDGGSLAIKGSLLRNGKWRVFIFDVQTGNVIYDGPFDWEGIWVEPNSPLYDWGITLPPQRRGGLEICSEPPQ
jgi:DNA-directed RNA polymerase specialized sigma24 family protein